jgi:hypothetical protein
LQAPHVNEVNKHGSLLYLEHTEIDAPEQFAVFNREPTKFTPTLVASESLVVKVVDFNNPTLVVWLTFITVTFLDNTLYDSKLSYTYTEQRIAFSSPLLETNFEVAEAREFLLRMTIFLAAVEEK